MTWTKLLCRVSQLVLMGFQTPCAAVPPPAVAPLTVRPPLPLMIKQTHLEAARSAWHISHERDAQVGHSLALLVCS